LAILYALKALCKDKNSLHVQILTDNTSAVAHINNMGGIKSDYLNSFSKDIWNCGNITGLCIKSSMTRGYQI
jgi:hypothetical protein